MSRPQRATIRPQNMGHQNRGGRMATPITHQQLHLQHQHQYLYEQQQHQQQQQVMTYAQHQPFTAQQPTAESMIPQQMVDDGVPKGTLAADYENKVRPLIDLIDKLRRLGLDKDVGLPSIVVVGDQSAGKSSVLEAISGVQLPRGSGITTRCPLELRLKRTDSSWEARILYRDHSEQLSSHEEVGPKVKEAQNALAGCGDGIMDEIITLEVVSRDLPDLTLIDLPGITRVAVQGQNQNVSTQIRGIIDRYITKKESIILAVAPANVDIATSEALQLAKRVDPEGLRTLGIITKMDLIDKGSERQIQKIMDNEHYKLRKGFIAVRCRGQQAIDKNQSLDDSLQEEQIFFQNSEHFRSYNELGQCGITSLSSRLAKELADHIEVILPVLNEKIYSQLDSCRRIVQELGEGLPKNSSKKRHFLSKLLQTYIDDLQRLADGNEGNIPPEFHLHKAARKKYEEFAVTIQNTLPQKHGQANAAYIEQIEKAMDDDRGRQPPDFMKFETFQRLVWAIVNEFQFPASMTLETIADSVRKNLTRLARKKCGAYPKLEAKISGIVGSVVGDMKTDCKVAIDNMFAMEELVYSQAQTYTRSLEQISAERNVHGHVDRSQKFSSNPESYKISEAQRMFTRIQAYLQICVVRVADIVPMIITQHIIMKVIELLRPKVYNLASPDSGALELLEEDSDQSRKRDMYRSKEKRLEGAKAELDKYFSGTGGSL